MSKRKWNRAAKNAANWIGDHLFERHRGAIVWHAGTAVIFGNDGYSSTAWVRQQVAILRQMLKDSDVKELGFGLADDGYTWALIVRSRWENYDTEPGRRFHIEMMEERLTDLVWDAWRATDEVKNAYSSNRTTVTTT